MAPTTTCCPHMAGPARGNTGPGPLGLQARQDRRGLCPQGRTPVAATRGTVLYRLRPSAALGARLSTLLAHGGPVPALVGAWGCAERPGTAWGARAGRPGQAGQAPLGEP